MYGLYCKFDLFYKTNECFCFNQVKNSDFFRSYITEDFDHYVTRKRREHCHGNHIEMIALSELYNRPIEVYEYSIGKSKTKIFSRHIYASLEPINIVHGMYKTDSEPIRLSYHCGIHYNSIIDPWRPTAGHGLGFPDLVPGVYNSFCFCLYKKTCILVITYFSVHKNH